METHLLATIFWFLGTFACALTFAGDSRRARIAPPFVATAFVLVLDFVWNVQMTPLFLTLPTWDILRRWLRRPNPHFLKREIAAYVICAGAFLTLSIAAAGDPIEAIDGIMTLMLWGFLIGMTSETAPFFRRRFARIDSP